MSVERLSGGGGESLMALRYKFAEDLEEILNCMVCLEKLTGPIPLCLQGHHVCRNCQLQMNDCPYCKSQFNGARNYLAETIVSKFEEIKSSLIDPQSYINEKKTVSVSIQTDTESLNSAGVEASNKDTKPLINYRVAPNVGKGKYPCKIGFCEEELVYGRMLSHLRYYHINELVEERITNSRSYENNWEFSYQIPNVLERAIHIPNMGLFVLIISIDGIGGLCGNLQIVNTRIVAKEFEYSLEIKTNHSSITYKGQVLPIRSRTPKNVNEKSLFISNSYLTHLLKRSKMFTCHLIINRIFASDPLK